MTVSPSVSRHGRELFHFQSHTLLEVEGVNWPYDGFTGSGLPDLLITEPGTVSYPHGQTHVFELSQDKMHCIADVLWGYYLYRDDLNHDGREEIIFGDPYVGLFNVPLHTGLSPPVVMSYQNGRYRVDTSLMWRPLPSRAGLQDWAREIRGYAQAKPPGYSPLGDEFAFQWAIPCVDSMQRMIYSGHLDTAREFLHLCWPPKWRGESEFWSGFIDSLSHSRYWPEIRTLNRM